MPPGPCVGPVSSSVLHFKGFRDLHEHILKKKQNDDVYVYAATVSQKALAE